MNEPYHLLQRHGIRWVEAPLPPQWGIAAGVSLRSGGVSPAPFESLNMATKVGDSPSNVRKNLSLLARATGIDLLRAHDIRLVHGTNVVFVGESQSGAEADGIVELGDIRAALAFTVADCFPVVLAAPGRFAAIIHCGWRSTVAGIIPYALGAIRSRIGSIPSETRAWIGPGIRRCCFDLPREEAHRFPPEYRNPSVATSGHESVDLPALLAAHLEAGGISEERILDAGLCTSCMTEWFFSHRRDHGRTGRMLAWVTPRRTRVEKQSSPSAPDFRGTR